MADQEVTCSNPECGAIIGEKILIENYEWLKVGGVIAREVRGVCANCGQGFYYSLSDRMLETLLNRVLSPK